MQFLILTIFCLRIVKRIVIIGGCQCTNEKEKIRIGKEEKQLQALHCRALVYVGVRKNKK